MQEKLDFEALYRLYFSPLYRYALVLCGSAAEAEDAVQNAFERAMRAEQGFRGDSSAKTWLFTITRNECLRQLGKRPPNENRESGELESAVYVEQTACDREAARVVLDYIEACGEPKKSLLAMRLLGERSFADIGAVLGKSDTWCRVTFLRAKNEILKRLEGYL